LTVIKVFKLNLVVKWVALMLFIEKVPGSNLSPELGYPV
jgi:hypothetical protein